MAPRVLVLALLLATVALTGCLDETFASYERSSMDDDDGGDIFTFDVPEGVDELQIVFSTEGLPSSPGTATLIIQPPGASNGPGFVYLKELAHGKSDASTLRNVEPGTYTGVIGFEDYAGPATVKVSGAGGATIPGLGGSFWDVLGVVLALLTLVGGALLYRRHSSRLNREMDRIDETFRELKDDVAQCRIELADMQEDLRRQLVQRRLKESHYLILEKRIERHLLDLDRIQGGSPSLPREFDVPIDME